MSQDEDTGAEVARSRAGSVVGSQSVGTGGRKND